MTRSKTSSSDGKYDLRSLPGYDHERDCFIDPSTRFEGGHCPDCGWPLIGFDIPLPFAGDPSKVFHMSGLCPRCMDDPPAEPGRDPINRRMEDARLPRRYRDVNPDTSHAGMLRMGCCLWVVGAGRSEAACRVLRAWLEGSDGLYSTGSEVGALGWGDLATHRTAGLLVLDDVAIPGVGAGKVADLMAERFRAARPTVATTAAPIEDVAGRCAPLRAVIDQMDESGAIEVVRA